MKTKLSALERFNEGGITGVVYAKKMTGKLQAADPYSKKDFIIKDQQVNVQLCFRVKQNVSSTKVSSSTIPYVSILVGWFGWLVIQPTTGLSPVE